MATQYIPKQDQLKDNPRLLKMAQKITKTWTILKDNFLLKNQAAAAAYIKLCHV